MTMQEMKKAIIDSFKKVYGFAPTQKAIRPLETSGRDGKLDWIAFHIGGIGYSYGIYGTVERNESYDM